MAYTFDDLLLELLGAPRSPLDRRGPMLGVPAVALPPVTTKRKPGTGAMPGALVAPIPGYEREFNVINQQSGGLVPHQGLGAVPK